MIGNPLSRGPLRGPEPAGDSGPGDLTSMCAIEVGTGGPGGVGWGSLALCAAVGDQASDGQGGLFEVLAAAEVAL